MKEEEETASGKRQRAGDFSWGYVWYSIFLFLTPSESFFSTVLCIVVCIQQVSSSLLCLFVDDLINSFFSITLLFTLLKVNNK
jgi:hypothetical protein